MARRASNARPILCAVLDGAALSRTPHGARETAAALFAAGVDWIQLRDRSLGSQELFAIACALVAARDDGPEERARTARHRQQAQRRRAGSRCRRGSPRRRCGRRALRRVARSKRGGRQHDPRRFPARRFAPLGRRARAPHPRRSAAHVRPARAHLVAALEAGRAPRARPHGPRAGRRARFGSGYRAARSGWPRLRPRDPGHRRRGDGHRGDRQRQPGERSCGGCPLAAPSTRSAGPVRIPGPLALAARPDGGRGARDEPAPRPRLQRVERAVAANLGGPRASRRSRFFHVQSDVESDAQSDSHSPRGRLRGGRARPAARRGEPGGRPLPAANGDGPGRRKGRARRRQHHDRAPARAAESLLLQSPARHRPALRRFLRPLLRIRRTPDPEPGLGRDLRSQRPRTDQRARDRPRRPGPGRDRRRARVRRRAGGRRPEQRPRRAPHPDRRSAALRAAWRLPRPDGRRARDRDRQSLRLLE